MLPSVTKQRSESLRVLSRLCIEQFGIILVLCDVRDPVEIFTEHEVRPTLHTMNCSISCNAYIGMNFGKVGKCIMQVRLAVFHWVRTQ
jgi:hypothetical protein